MDTVRIDRFTSRVHAELASSMLVAHGINARVSGDDVGGIHPDIPYGIGGTAVVVPRDQLEEANALLDEVFVGEPGDDDAAHRATREDDAPDGARGPSASDVPDVDSWSTVDGAASRRPGMRVFAVVAAASLLLVFLAATGGTIGWW